jgi:peroxiredoxin
MRNVVTLFVVAAVAGFLAYRLRQPDADGAGPPVGRPAPEFAATTVDGQIVRLADLRGKVVVLDFWATWCPPCRAMIPHERDLVKRLASKPFAFIGISADSDAETLRRFVAKEHMPWPNIHDGPGGPVGKLFEIQFYPSVYVLDARGVVRYKHVRGHDLDEAVDKLLAETPG